MQIIYEFKLCNVYYFFYLEYLGYYELGTKIISISIINIFKQINLLFKMIFFKKELQKYKYIYIHKNIKKFK